MTDPRPGKWHCRMTLAIKVISLAATLVAMAIGCTMMA